MKSFTCEIFSGMQSSRVFGLLNSLWIEEDTRECNGVGLPAMRFSLILFLQSLNITQFDGLFLLLSGKSWQILNVISSLTTRESFHLQAESEKRQRWRQWDQALWRPCHQGPSVTQICLLCNHFFSSDHIRAQGVSLCQYNIRSLVLNVIKRMRSLLSP